MSIKKYTAETTGITEAQVKTLLQSFYERIISSPDNHEMIVINGLRFKRNGDMEVSPTHLFRYPAYFGKHFSKDNPPNLDLEMISETLYDILIYHCALGGGWIKVIAVKPFSEREDGLLLYETSL